MYFSIGLHLALSVDLALFYWSNVFYTEIVSGMLQLLSLLPYAISLTNAHACDFFLS